MGLKPVMPSGDSVSKTKLYLFVKDGCLYAEDSDGVDQVTHIQRTDGGGVDVHQVHVKHDEVWMCSGSGRPSYTLPIAPDGRVTNKVPGGYQYSLVVAKRPKALPDD